MKLHDVNIANPTRRLVLALLLHGPVAACLVLYFWPASRSVGSATTHSDVNSLPSITINRKSKLRLLHKHTTNKSLHQSNFSCQTFYVGSRKDSWSLLHSFPQNTINYIFFTLKVINLHMHSEPDSTLYYTHTLKQSFW